jgi:hypothetical protein
MHEVSPSAERRRSARLQPRGIIQVTVSRGTGRIIDLSHGGTRVRHTGAVRRGAEVRFTFEWDDARFDACAEVLSSRVDSLGDADRESTIYETRLRFTRVSPPSRDVLRRVLEATSNDELRRWVANLRGWSDGTTPDPMPACGSFLRCTLGGNGWRKVTTTHHEQPLCGFVLPASVSAREVSLLCETYQRASEDGRHLIRLTAAAVVEEALARSPVAA